MAYVQPSFSLADDVTPNLRKSEGLQRRAHRLIPGGAHTYAKGDDQYPVDAPAFIVRGPGCSRLGSRRPASTSSTEWVCGPSLSDTPIHPVVEAASPPCGSAPTSPVPPPSRSSCAEALLGLVHGRHGQVRQERLRRDDRRRQARPRRDGPRPRGDLQRPALLLDR